MQTILLRMSHGTRTLLALAVGVGLGTLATAFDLTPVKQLAGFIEPVGTLWVNAIRMTVIPLMVALIVRGIALQDPRHTGRTSGRTLVWFAVLIAGTTTFAALVTPPLLGLWTGPAGEAGALVGTASQRPALPPFREWLVGLVPANPIRAAADGAILPLAVFSILFGLALARVNDNGRATLLQLAGAIVKRCSWWWSGCSGLHHSGCWRCRSAWSCERAPARRACSASSSC